MATTLDPGSLTTSYGLIFRQLAALTWQKKPWPPSRVARLLWSGLTSLGTQRKIVHLLRAEPFAELARKKPEFAFKYATLDYLAIGLTAPQRAASFLHHYTRLHKALPVPVLRHMLQSDVTLHRIPTQALHCAITMGMSEPVENEGEMSLNMRVDGEIVSVLSFTIVPGPVVRSRAEDVVLVTRVQGVKGCFPQIQATTKALCDVAPAHLLLAALQGVANALGITEFAAINATMQRSTNLVDPGLRFDKSYDEFFCGLGFAQTPEGFFMSPIPIPDKPLTCIKPGHKIRTKEKRAFKREVQSACAAFLRGIHPAFSSHPAA